MITVIVGPTAVGKSKLAIELAKQINAEIISGDSVQIYKHLNIGSAKITTDEQQGIVHHLIDVYDLETPYSVADFQREVRAKIKDIEARGKRVIICGGTGFYLKAALFNYVFDHQGRQLDFESSLAEKTNDELYQWLQDIDPESAAKFHPNNRVRILRALGYYLQTGEVISKEASKDEALYNVLLIGLSMDRELLYERINQRVDQMIADGLLEEVQGLRAYEEHIQAIGYNELFEYLNGMTSFEEAVALIKQHSRQLAKRQWTWFRNQMKVHWLDATTPIDQLMEQALQLMDTK
jgi:tRNA dimethylallyltransferase